MDDGTPQRDNALLDFSDLRALDAQYRPIAKFSEWVALSIDAEIWARQLAELDARRGELTQEKVEKAIETATRAAAVDTGAIEGLYETDRGLTYTIAVKGTDWESSMRSSSPQMHDFFQAQLRAYDLASEVAAAERPVTEVWVRELHTVLTEPQAEYDVLTAHGWTKSPLPKGKYKSQPNHVRQADGSTHAYAPVDTTGPEMHRLVNELNSEDFAEAHAVLQAAYAHYCLVAIHPFADGNGRVARAVGSVYLRRASNIPLLIWADQRPDYFNALEAADRGDLQRFVDFVFDRGIDALTFIVNEMGPRPSDFADDFTQLYSSYGGLTFDALDEISRKIMQAVLDVLSQVATTSNLPAEVSAGVSSSNVSPYGVSDESYRSPLKHARVVELTLSTPPPANAQIRLSYRMLVAREPRVRYAFRVECGGESKNSLPVRLDDVHPEVSDSLTRQLLPWITSTVGQATRNLLASARATHQKEGYS